MGLGSGDPSDSGVLVKPPKHLGSIDSVVEQVTGDESIGLLPESDFRGTSFVPAVTNDAVFIGHLSSKHGGLDGACDCRNRWGPNASRTELRDARRVLEQHTRESYYTDDTNALHGSISASCWLNDTMAGTLGAARIRCLGVAIALYIRPAFWS